MLSLLSPTGVSALEARAYFLLLRQKKVAKEKATPGSAPGCARFPALLGTPGTPRALPRDAKHRSGRGCATRSFGPQTVLADCPRRSCVARRLPRGPENRPYSWRLPVELGRLSGPRVQRRATEKPAEKGRGLSEGRRPEFRRPRRLRVAQGSPRRGPRNPGSPFLWLLSFGEAKESTLANKAKPQANQNNNSIGGCGQKPSP